jgi:hypothetical protein
MYLPIYLSVCLSFYSRIYSQCSFIIFCIITCREFCWSQLLSPLWYAIPITFRGTLNHCRWWDMGKPTRNIQSLRKIPKVFRMRRKHINQSKFFCTELTAFFKKEFLNKRYSTLIYACSAHSRYSSCCWQATAFPPSMYRRWWPLITLKSFAREVSPAHSELSSQQLHLMCKVRHHAFRNVMLTLHSLRIFVCLTLI